MADTLRLVSAFSLSQGGRGDKSRKKFLDKLEEQSQ